MKLKGSPENFQVASTLFSYLPQHDTAVSGSRADLQVTVQNNQDLLVRSNSIVSDAGGKIELNAAENHYRNEDTHRSRRSGLTFGMHDGVANIGYSQLLKIGKS